MSHDPDAPTMSPAAPAPRPLARVPWSRQPRVLAATGVALLAFGVVLGVLVVRFTGPAPPDPMASMPEMTGPVATGGPTGTSTAPREGGSGQPIPKDMLEGMLRAAHGSFDAGRYPEALAAYQAVLKRDPQHVEAMTHLGVILALAGHVEEALAAFDRALAIDPTYVHALWDKARTLHELRQDYTAALPAWERVLQVLPAGQDRERVLAKIRDAKARLAAESPPGGQQPARSDADSGPAGSPRSGAGPQRGAP